MLKISNKVLKIGDKWLNGYKNLNPLNLPPYTIRLKFNEGVTPSFSKGTGVQVSSSPNIWDLTYENSDWSSLLSNQTVIEVLGANSKYVTNMRFMFDACQSLITVPLFDTRTVTNMSYMFSWCFSLITAPLFYTSSVTDMEQMFSRCSSLIAVPLLDTNNVTNMIRMFYDCTNVQSGALDLYYQASTQQYPPTKHSMAFENCGSNTTTGAAELAQIPNDWK